MSLTIVNSFDLSKIEDVEVRNFNNKYNPNISTSEQRLVFKKNESS